MTKSEALANAVLADILSYSNQIGLITALQLRKNLEIKKSLLEERDNIEKIAQEKKGKKTEEQLKLEVETATKEWGNQNFDGNLYMVTIDQVGDIKCENISLSTGGFMDARTIAEGILNKVIINTYEQNS